MNADSRFYWLKLQRDFFRRPEIDVLEGMPNGKEYVLFYLKLLCESVGRDGFLRLTDTVPYNDEMLAAITRTNVDIVRSAVKVFHEMGFMEVMDDGTLFLCETQAMIGAAANTDAANRKRIQRQREAMGHICDTNVTKSHEICDTNVTKSHESKSKSKSKSIDIEKEKKEKKTARFTPPTLAQVQEYCQERGNAVNAERFVDYYSSNGWKVGKNSMKDWKAAVRSWEQRDKDERKEKEPEHIYAFNDDRRNDPYKEPFWG